MCPDYDAFGITLDGGFAEYLRVPGIAVQRGNVFRLPDALSYAEAALVEPLSCCLRGQDALRRAARRRGRGHRGRADRASST